MSPLTEAQEACRKAEAVIITAGAGMGVDSGLPDFRGNKGFWKAYPPYQHLGMSFTDMACPDRFVHEPELGWGFYGHRLDLYRRTQPHAGFSILKTWAEQLPKGGFVFTSNVDGHFQVAGFPEENVVECHGSIRHLQCFERCQRNIWSADEQEFQIDPESMRLTSPLPTCPHCGRLARPNILMFGDWGWIEDRSQEQTERLVAWESTLGEDTPLVVLEFGAGTAVPSVRHFSERQAQRENTTFIRVNPRESRIPEGRGIRLPMGALEALEVLQLDC